MISEQYNVTCPAAVSCDQKLTSNMVGVALVQLELNLLHIY